MYQYKIKEIIKIVDGDTIDVNIDLGFDVTVKQRVRLDGIDTPESITSNLLEKQMGLESKRYLENWLSDKKDLIISTSKDDKYGRILARISDNTSSICINDEMIKLGYAWSYDGGTKKKDLQELITKKAQAKNPQPLDTKLA
jgi:micrococcal nuclease